MFPVTVNDICKAQVSLQRVEAYLRSKELDGANVVAQLPELDKCVAISVEKGEFSWEDDSNNITLRNVNVNVKKGELVACVGAVGSGKSSFLASVLGEMHKLRGRVHIDKPSRWSFCKHNKIPREWLNFISKYAWLTEMSFTVIMKLKNALLCNSKEILN